MQNWNCKKKSNVNFIQHFFVVFLLLILFFFLFCFRVHKVDLLEKKKKNRWQQKVTQKLLFFLPGKSYYLQNKTFTISWVLHNISVHKPILPQFPSNWLVICLSHGEDLKHLLWMYASQKQKYKKNSFPKLSKYFFFVFVVFFFNKYWNSVVSNVTSFSKMQPNSFSIKE